MANAVSPRDVKEIYISDYDGANQRRVTVTRKLNIMPRWSPDARAIAYTSYRRDFPDIYVSLLYQGTLENPTGGRGQNWLPAWSPDGTRLCFTSTRDGNSELYVMNRDGSNVTRLTNHPAIDTTPTWSPGGTQIAFVSDRNGSPQIYIVDADGLNLRKLTSESWCDRPTWSPAPFNEIAYASRSGPGYDIRIYDLATQERRQLTSGEGSNESPSYAPNGRHLAFMSTRTGKKQIFVMGRDGQDVSADHDRREQLHARLVEVTGERDKGYAHPKGRLRSARGRGDRLARVRRLQIQEAAGRQAAAASTGDDARRAAAAGPGRPDQESPIVTAPAVAEDPMVARSVDDLNRDSPLRAAFFEYDSADLTAEARSVLDADAATLKKYRTWAVTIEGHCDERGTAEYNLALGERRAVAAQAYLVSLGIPADRLRTVSYGKEFPFDAGHDEAAYAKNRRAHFVITGK